MSQATAGSKEGQEFSALNILISVIEKLDTSAGASEEEKRTQIIKALSQQLGISESGTLAVLRGWASVAEYAAMDSDENEGALGEEDMAVEASRRAFRPVFEARMQDRADKIDEEMAGKVVCAACGKTMLSKGRRGRKWESSLGPITIHRRWNVCSTEGHGTGRSVVQEKLGLPSGHYTARLAEAMAKLSTASSSHGMAASILGSLLGVDVSVHGCENVVHHRAERLLELDEADADTQAPFDEDGHLREVPRPDDAVEEAPSVAYVEVDGVFPMTRHKDSERSKPVDGARGGKGLRYNLEGREVKNAVLYTADAAVWESDSRGSILDKQYVSVLGSHARFQLHLWATMRQLRYDEADTIVLLSDGATWIREMADWLPVSAKVVLILDMFHAFHRVWEVGNAIFGAQSEQAEQWARIQTDAIREGNVSHVIDRLRFIKAPTQAVAKKVSELITYFSNNRDRMNYPLYRKQGFRVTSAAVESANFHVTGNRLKLQGMRWSEPGAAQMARLRADLFNDVWRQRTLQVLAA